MGAEAVRMLLEELDLEQLKQDLRKESDETGVRPRRKADQAPENC